MTTIYYIDSTGHPQTADLSIIDIDNGCRCERDILGNMDIGDCGNVNFVPDDQGDCESDIQLAALAAGATYYTDDAAAAQWWIDYVDGYNATQADLHDLIAELRDMDDDTIRAIVCEYMGNDPRRHIHDSAVVNRLIESLMSGADDYEMERDTFIAARDSLRSIIDSAT